MGVAVLIGFSCAGKSSVRAPLFKYLKNKGVTPLPDWKDTDKEICNGQPYQGIIYRVFVDLVTANNTTAAMNYIHTQQLQFLKTFTAGDTPTLIAAGPIMPRYPEFRTFVARNKAKCFYLKLNPTRTHQRLRTRQDAHGNKTIDNQKLHTYMQFGSWNDFVLNHWDDAKPGWIAHSVDDQLTNIKALMRAWQPDYERCADFTLDMNLRDDDPKRKEYIQKLEQVLYDL